MYKINFLGTGSAMVTKCFNTCFTLSNNSDEHFLVDTGGGNLLLTNLEKLNIPINKIHHLFLTHSHNDHLNGISWIVRSVATQIFKDNYTGDLTIYGHKDLLVKARNLCTILLGDKFINLFDDRIKFLEVTHDQTVDILDFKVTFFDIQSTKLKQFGFYLSTSNNTTMCFLGDEGYKEHLHSYCANADYLIHEAFCLFEESSKYKPHEKHHSHVKDAAENAAALNVNNLILIHTEDDNLKNKKDFYSAEANYFFKGNVLVPMDLESIELS